jgi:hypothetical protein
VGVKSASVRRSIPTSRFKLCTVVDGEIALGACSEQELLRRLLGVPIHRVDLDCRRRNSERYRSSGSAVRSSDAMTSAGDVTVCQ